MFSTRSRWSLPFVAALAFCLSGSALADDDDEFDFLEDEDDELIIIPSDGEVNRDNVIDMGDGDPDWDTGAPSNDLPEFGEEDPVEDFDVPEEDMMIPEVEEEVDIRGREEDRGITLPIDGKLPLMDNYPLQVVAKDLDAIVVELPVLIAQSRSDFEQEFWLVTEIRVNGERVGETRQLVTAESLSDLAASFTWVKAFVPVSESRGTVEFRVDREDPETGEAQPQFTASTSYEL